MKKIIFILVSLLLLLKCYNPLDFNEYDKLTIEERVNNFTGYSELTNFSVRLEWEPKTYNDFLSYKIYRSNNLPVDESSDLVFYSEIKSDTCFYDYILEPSTKYFYKIYTFYKDNIIAKGNSTEITTSNAPSKDYILFSDYPSRGKIYKMSIDGSQKIDLYSSGYTPAWHPKGYCFAYADYSKDSNYDYEIYLADLAGTTSFSIGKIDTIGLSTYEYANNICWSRNSNYIYIQFCRVDLIYKIDVKNKSLKFFMNGDNISCNPVKDEILVSTQGKDVEVFNYSGQLLKSYNFQQTASTNGNYSPTGDRFIFQGGFTYIYNFQNSTSTDLQKGSCDNFFWSPNGSNIFFLFGSKLYKINGDGTGDNILVAEDIYNPDWSIIN